MAASISKFMGGAVHCKHVLQACFCLETVANVARIVDAECGLCESPRGTGKVVSPTT